MPDSEMLEVKRCGARFALNPDLQITQTLDSEKPIKDPSFSFNQSSLLRFSDLSHNKISDSGARAVGKLLNGRCNLTTLNLCDNKIRSAGAAAIGHALGKNTTLTSINLRLNR